MKGHGRTAFPGRARRRIARIGSTPPRPSIWPLIGLLLPNVALAVLAAVALMRDWRAARREAATRAHELATAVVTRVLNLLEAPPAAVVTASGQNSPDASGLAAQLDWVEIGHSNELIAPPRPAWPPQPQPLVGGLPLERQARWDAARAALIAGDAAAAVEAYGAFLDLQTDPDSQTGPDSRTDPATDSREARYQSLALFERALALELKGDHDNLSEEFNRVLAADIPGAAGVLTEAGVPVSQLAALRILEIARDRHEMLPAVWRSDPLRVTSLLAESPPTPFLTSITERIRPFVSRLAGAIPGGDESTLFEPLERSQRSRRHYSAAVDQYGLDRPWPEVFWMSEDSSAWLALRDVSTSTPDGDSEAQRRRYVFVPEDSLRRNLESVLLSEDRDRNYALQLEIAGRKIVAASRAEVRETNEILARATRVIGSGVPVVVAASLVDPDAFYTGQRQRLRLFTGILVSALIVAGVSVAATRGALLRQHEINVQKSNFVSAVSHELRAPLGSIRLLTEGLERGTITGEARRQEYLQLIGQETRRLASLVENVLDFSRIEQGRKRYDLEPTDMIALVRGSLALIEPMALVRDVRLELRLPEAPLELHADGRALQQALLNLLDNALKHSPAGETVIVSLGVEVTTSDGQSVVRLAVADSGPGIPPAEHQRIFEAFYRRGSELRRESPGVGIGLSIVQHIVEAHGGWVELTSDSGRGAVFAMCFSIPRDSAPSEESGSSAATSINKDQPGCRAS